MAEQKKHLDFLRMGKDALNDIKSVFVNRANKKKTELWIVQKESEISDLELALIEEESNKDFSIVKVMGREDDLQVAQRELILSKKILKKLF